MGMKHFIAKKFIQLACLFIEGYPVVFVSHGVIDVRTVIHNISEKEWIGKNE